MIQDSTHRRQPEFPFERSREGGFRLIAEPVGKATLSDGVNLTGLPEGTAPDGKIQWRASKLVNLLYVSPDSLVEMRLPPFGLSWPSSPPAHEFGFANTERVAGGVSALVQPSVISTWICARTRPLLSNSIQF